MAERLSSLWRAWLTQSKPVSADDFAMRLLGLAWSDAAQADLRQPARDLLALQREDGGWSGNPYPEERCLFDCAMSSEMRKSNARRQECLRYGERYRLLFGCR